MKDTRTATIRFRLLKLSDNNVAQPLSPMVHPTASTTSQDGQPEQGGHTAAWHPFRWALSPPATTPDRSRGQDGQPDHLGHPPVFVIRVVLDTVSLTVETTVESQLSVMVSEGDL